MIITPIKSKIFRAAESLDKYIQAHVPTLKEKSILVVTSKIVALSQGRVVENKRGLKTRLIKSESQIALKTKWCYLALKDGHWCPNAGIDESNADGKLILWPEDSYRVAFKLRKKLMQIYHVRQLGILITDSRIYPLRAGVTGVALGYAGFQGLRDYRGKKDIFGRALTMTQTNVADSLACAAVLVMGEGNERIPLAIIEDAPVKFIAKVDPLELRIDPKIDMYRPLFRFLDKGKKK